MGENANSTRGSAVVSGDGEVYTPSDFDVRSWQGLTKLLQAARNSGMSDKEYHDLRDTVLSYAQSGGSEELKEKINKKISQLTKNAPSSSTDGKKDTATQPEVSSKSVHSQQVPPPPPPQQQTPPAPPPSPPQQQQVVPTPQQQQVASPPPPPLPRTTQKQAAFQPVSTPPQTQVSSPTPQATQHNVTAPSVQQNTQILPTSYPPPPPPQQQTPPAPPPSPQQQQQVVSPQAVLQTSSMRDPDEYRARIAEIKRTVHDRVGNPTSLIDADNDLGKEYMKALLQAMKSLGGGAPGSRETSMAALERAFELLIESANAGTLKADNVSESQSKGDSHTEETTKATETLPRPQRQEPPPPPPQQQVASPSPPPSPPPQKQKAPPPPPPVQRPVVSPPPPPPSSPPKLTKPAQSVQKALPHTPQKERAPEKKEHHVSVPLHRAAEDSVKSVESKPSVKQTQKTEKEKPKIPMQAELLKEKEMRGEQPVAEKVPDKKPQKYTLPHSSTLQKQPKMADEPPKGKDVQEVELKKEKTEEKTKEIERQPILSQGLHKTRTSPIPSLADTVGILRERTEPVSLKRKAEEFEEGSKKEPDKPKQKISTPIPQAPLTKDVPKPKPKHDLKLSEFGSDQGEEVKDEVEKEMVKDEPKKDEAKNEDKPDESYHNKYVRPNPVAANYTPPKYKHELNSSVVTQMLEQLLHEWKLFRRSGLFGVGPSGSEHPLYQKLAGVSMFAVLSGKFDHATPEVVESINDYVNAWRHEQGIVYMPGETFDHYLRRVIQRILKRQEQ